MWVAFQFRWDDDDVIGFSAPYGSKFAFSHMWFFSLVEGGKFEGRHGIFNVKQLAGMPKVLWHTFQFNF